MSFVMTFEEYYKSLGWTLIMSDAKETKQKQNSLTNNEEEETTKKTIDN